MKTCFASVIFKIKLLILIFLSMLKSGSSQTWVRTPYFDINSGIGFQIYDDTTQVGPLQMCKTQNGNIIALMNIDPVHNTSLYNIDSVGNFSWGIPVAHSGSIYDENCYSLHSTSDNGIVYVARHDSYGMNVNDKVYKLNSSGNTTWMMEFNTASWETNTLVKAIIPTSHNTFYLQFTDSLVELNNYGTFIRNRFPFSGNLTVLPDSDFILSSSTTTSRQDFNGNISWSINVAGSVYLSADTSFIYMVGGSLIKKIRTGDGSLAWSNPFPYRVLSVTADGGIIACNSASDPNSIARYDSSGTLVWSRLIPFSYFGYRSIIESKPNFFVTGGAYKSTYLDYLGLSHGYGFSSFLFQIDSSGHGVVDSTNYFFNGNANDNTTLSFADDACYVAAAINNSGSARDLELRGAPLRSVFATDWTGQFCTVVNYKFSDVDGNGFIDSADIRLLSYYSDYSRTVPSHWRMTNHNFVLPDLILKYEKDTVSPGDTLTAYFILGSSITPVDSIYSLSLSIYQLYRFESGICNVPISNFGDSTLNLYSFFSFPTSIYNADFVISRQDHQNAYLNGDTIAVFHFILRNNTHSGLYTFYIDYNAITECGSPVLLNIVSDTIFVPETTGIKTLSSNGIKIFPNPATDEIFFSLDKENCHELIIMDNIGNEILKIKNPEKEFKVNLSGFANGIYYVSFKSENNIYKSKFIVNR